MLYYPEVKILSQKERITIGLPSNKSKVVANTSRHLKTIKMVFRTIMKNTFIYFFFINFSLLNPPLYIFQGVYFSDLCFIIFLVLCSGCVINMQNIWSGNKNRLLMNAQDFCVSGVFEFGVCHLIAEVNDNTRPTLHYYCVQARGSRWSAKHLLVSKS